MKSWNMLKYFSERMEVGLACPLKYGDQEVGELCQLISFKNFIYDEVIVKRSAKNLITSYFRGIPLNVYRSRSRKIVDHVFAIGNEYDVILIDHYEAFQYLPLDFKGKVIFHAHNATYLLWERYSKGDNPVLQRWAAGLESKRLKTYEIAACARADLVFASPNDLSALSSIGVDRRKLRETYHLGDDSQLDLPPLKFHETENSLLYIGTLNWEANVDGLLWFFAEVWPRLIAKHPALSMFVVGGNVDERLIMAAKPYPSVSFTGFVKDLEPYFLRARLSIAPLRFGSGIKVKVLNSMCRGLPIVTTSVGAEGLAVEHMEHLAIADSASEMVESIDRLMRDTMTWERIQSCSRQLIREKYTWKRVMGYMESEIKGLLKN